MPLRLIVIACLELCLANVEMCSFHNAIHVRVIPRDSNVANVVSLAQIVKGFNEGGAVVHDDLTKSAPSAKNIVEYSITNGLHSLSAKNVILRIVHE